MSQVSPLLDAPHPVKPGRSVPVPLAATAAVLGLAHLPMLIAFGRQLWLRPHYQLFPLVIAGAAVLARPAWRLAVGGSPAPSAAARRAGAALLGLNWLLLAAALVIDSPWLAGVAAWELLVAVAVLAGGWPVLRAALPALAYLLLIVPPPLNLDGRLVGALQTLTAKCSSRVLDYVGVFHTLSGHTVEVAGKSYFVEEACSGIHSLLSVLAVTLFYVLWAHCHWLRAVLLGLAAVFWVVAANIARIVAIVYVDARWKVDLSQGAWHFVFGFVLFALTLAVLASTDRLLLFLGTAVRWGGWPSEAEPEAAAAPAEGPAARAPPGWAAAAPALAAYGALVLFQAGELGPGGGGLFGDSPLVAYYNGFGPADLPERVGPWVRQPDATFEARDRDNPLDPFGAHSRAWRYQKDGGLTAVVSFDYPFPMWHDLRGCYRTTGWTVESSETFTHRAADGGELECVRFAMTRPVERRGYGWFGEFDPAGRPVEAKEPALGYRHFHLVDRLYGVRDRWLSILGWRPAQPHYYDILQVQTLIEGYGPLSGAEQEQARLLFVTSLDAIRAKCVAGAAGRAAP
jgi:exosortase